MYSKVFLYLVLEKLSAFLAHKGFCTLFMDSHVSLEVVGIFESFAANITSEIIKINWLIIYVEQ